MKPLFNLHNKLSFHKTTLKPKENTIIQILKWKMHFPKSSFKFFRYNNIHNFPLGKHQLKENIFYGFI